MPDQFAELRHELAVANRILANEGIIDAFGHISARNPKDPNRYFISRHRASELVEPSDILEMTLDSKPVVPTSLRLYSEMVIHGEIYKARPDVNSVCHHHAPSVLPFCATGVELVPLFHLGGTLGAKVPFWDSRDEFGDTNLLVRTPEEGASHARALGPHWMLLLRRHGASLAGKSVRECVFRSIYTTRNAELQLRAMAIGTLGPLSAGEAEKCGGHNLGARGVERAWEYWVTRLQKAEAMRERSEPEQEGRREEEAAQRGVDPVAALGAATRSAIHASVTGARRITQQITIVAARSPIVAKNDFYSHALSHQHRGNTMQTQRTYQVQHWPNGQWSHEHNWKKVEAASEKAAAEKVCGRTLKQNGTLAQLRARVLTLGDLKQRSATPFYAAE